MRIGIVDVDGHSGFPNLALMKISAWHKSQGDSVEWFSPLYSNVKKVYASKIFTFTQDYGYFPNGVEISKGGTGYDIAGTLPAEIDNMQPDYSIYPNVDYAVGFLSRGCIRNCPWCVVPKKEGYIRKYSSLDNVFQGRKQVILMDNNFLANDFSFVKEQLELSAKLNVRIDFNQAMDCRLVTDEIAKAICKAKWIRNTLRFSCDTDSMFEPLKKCIETINRYATVVYEFFIYVLVKNFNDGYERVKRVRALGKRVKPFVMPYKHLDLSHAEYAERVNNPTFEERQIALLAEWNNKQMVSCNTKLEDFDRYKKLMKGTKE